MSKSALLIRAYSRIKIFIVLTFIDIGAQVSISIKFLGGFI